MSNSNTEFQNDPVELQKLGETVIKLANANSGFMNWMKTFEIDDTYLQAIISPFLYTEYILRHSYGQNFDYDRNRDIGDAVINWIDSHKLADGLNDEKYEEVVGVVLLAHQTGISTNNTQTDC